MPTASRMPTAPAPTAVLDARDVLDDEVIDLSEFEAEFASLWTRHRRTLRSLIVGFVAFLVVGNALILAASAWAKHTAPGAAIEVPAEVAAISNFQAVDPILWRGGAPTVDQYRALGDAGVTTVIDLRAEEDLDVPTEVLADAGIELVTIPMRDGQAPSPGQVDQFLTAVSNADGAIYVHCGAGVGRTGTMVATYRAARGEGGWAAMRANLAVGPPSLEQLAFAASLEPGANVHRPNAVVVAVSRTLDGPRRIWKVLEGL